MPAPIRWAHTGAAFVGWVLQPLLAWMNARQRRAWARPIVLGVVGALITGIFDGCFTRSVRDTGLWRPDLAGVLRYAIVLGSIVVAAAMWLQDPRNRANRARVLAWAAAAVCALLGCRALSMLVGRPRPRFDDPGYFINPLGAYPLGPGLGIRHAWEFWAGGVWDVWSMPSVESAWAMLGALIVGRAYPRLRILAGITGVGVGAAVVLTGLGFLSDAMLGGALGVAIGRVAPKWFPVDPAMTQPEATDHSRN